MGPQHLREVVRVPLLRLRALVRVPRLRGHSP
jgi:hypothetical protein